MSGVGQDRTELSKILSSAVPRVGQDMTELSKILSSAVSGVGQDRKELSKILSSAVFGVGQDMASLHAKAPSAENPKLSKILSLVASEYGFARFTYLHEDYFCNFRLPGSVKSPPSPLIIILKHKETRSISRELDFQL